MFSVCGWVCYYEQISNYRCHPKEITTYYQQEKWTLKNGFTISKNKTVAMHFVPIKMHGSCFEIGQWPYPVCKRSLISWFGLGYKTHLWTSYKKSLNILKVLFRTEWGADRTALLKLYHSLLDQNWITIYGSASKTALVKLDPVHNQSLRLSLGAFRSSRVESLCWSPWTSIGNSQRKVSSVIHHNTKSQSRKSNIRCCVQSQIPKSLFK